MAFKDLREFVTGRELSLPIGGKTYLIREPDALTGAWVQQLMWIGEGAADAKDGPKDDLEARVVAAMLTDDQEESLYRRVLGPVWHEMAANGVTFDEAKHAGLTAAIWLIYGEAAAEAYWLSPGKGHGEGDGQGEARTPDSRASRPAFGAAATMTPTRASGSGTRAGTTRRAARRRGGRSSPSGR